MKNLSLFVVGAVLFSVVGDWALESAGISHLKALSAIAGLAILVSATVFCTGEVSAITFAAVNLASVVYATAVTARYDSAVCFAALAFTVGIVAVFTRLVAHDLDLECRWICPVLLVEAGTIFAGLQAQELHQKVFCAAIGIVMIGVAYAVSALVHRREATSRIPVDKN